MRSSVGAEMMIMVIMMMGDDQDMGLDPVQRRSVFFPQCVQMYSSVYSVKQLYIKEAGDNAECAVSHSWEAARRGAQSDMRVIHGDNSDTEPGRNKGALCRATE